MKKPMTSHRAASLERQAWLAKVRRMIRTTKSTAKWDALLALEKWGQDRVKRFEAKKGGLGK